MHYKKTLNCRCFQSLLFFARKQLLLSARLSHRNSVRPSACLVGSEMCIRDRKKRFFARKQLLLSARLSHRNSVRPSVRHTGGLDQSKMARARITKSSPSAAEETLVPGTEKLFHKFGRGHPKRERYVRGVRNVCDF